MTKKDLKDVIKETVRIVLREMSEPKRRMTGPYAVYTNGKYLYARKDEDTGVYYYLNPDTGTEVPLGKEGPNLSVDRKKLSEMTTTGNVEGYNVPGWVSKKGGSHKGVAGSDKLGYHLTSIGKKDMERKQDPV